MTATGTPACCEAISAMRSSPSPASTAPTISRWAPRGVGRDSGADTSRRCTLLGLYTGLVRLEHLLAGLAGPDADRILDREDEDLPVPDRARAGVLEDHLVNHRRVHVLDHALQLELRPEVDRDRRAAVVLRDPLLTPRALHLHDRDAREAALEQLLTDRLERLVTYVCDDHLHADTPSVVIAVTAGAAAGLYPFVSAGIAP